MDHGKNEGVKKAGERDYTPQIEGTKEGAGKLGGPECAPFFFARAIAA